MNEPIPMPKQPKFRKQGLGYVYDTEGFRLTLSRIKHGESMTGYLYVESTMKDMAGPLVANRFNLDSLTARKGQAGHLSGRTQGMQVDWVDILDRFCLLVAKAETTMENFTTVGDRPTRVKSTWLVENLVLDNQPCTVFAPGGSGKTYFGLAIGTSVQTGKEIIPTLRPMRTGRVLLLDYETTEDDIDDRVKSICEAAGMPQVSLGYLRCTGSVGDMIEEIARYVASENVVLVILDSVEMATASQHESSDANQAIIDLYRALRLLNVSTLLIDHVNASEASKTKGNRRPYGSIYKINLARIAFELRLGANDGGVANIGLYNIKRNGGPILKPVGLSTLFSDEGVKYVKQDITVDSTLAEGLNRGDRVYSYLTKHPSSKVKDIAEALEMAESDVRAVFSEDKSGRFYRHDEKDGRSALWSVQSKQPEPEEYRPF